MALPPDALDVFKLVYNEAETALNVVPVEGTPTPAELTTDLDALQVLERVYDPVTQRLRVIYV